MWKFNVQGTEYYTSQAISTQMWRVGCFMTNSSVSLLPGELHSWVADYNWMNEILTWISIYYFYKPGAPVTSFVYCAID